MIHHVQKKTYKQAEQLLDLNKTRFSFYNTHTHFVLHQYLKIQYGNIAFTVKLEWNLMLVGLCKRFLYLKSYWSCFYSLKVFIMLSYCVLFSLFFRLHTHNTSNAIITPATRSVKPTINLLFFFTSFPLASFNIQAWLWLWLKCMSLFFPTSSSWKSNCDPVHSGKTFIRSIWSERLVF